MDEVSRETCVTFDKSRVEKLLLFSLVTSLMQKVEAAGEAFAIGVGSRFSVLKCWSTTNIQTVKKSGWCLGLLYSAGHWGRRLRVWRVASGPGSDSPEVAASVRCRHFPSQASLSSPFCSPPGGLRTILSVSFVHCAELLSLRRSIYSTISSSLAVFFFVVRVPQLDLWWTVILKAFHPFHQYSEHVLKPYSLWMLIVLSLHWLI